MSSTPAEASFADSKRMAAKRSLRLAFVGDRPVFLANRIWVGDGLGRPIDALRGRVSQLNLAPGRRDQKSPWMSHQLDISQIELIPMPPNPGIRWGSVFFARDISTAHI